MKVIEFPLTRITIGFILGILLGYYYEINPKLAFLLLFITLITFVTTYLFSKRQQTVSLYFSLSTYFLALVIGLTTQIIHTESYQEKNYIHDKTLFDQNHQLIVTVREKLRSSRYNDRYIVLVKKIDRVEYNGKILLNIRKDSLKPPFEIGTPLRIN